MNLLKMVYSGGSGFCSTFYLISSNGIVHLYHCCSLKKSHKDLCTCLTSRMQVASWASMELLRHKISKAYNV